MTTKPLAAIEKTNLVLALAVTALGGVVWGWAGLLAAGVGAALACINLWAIHRLGARAMARAAAGATAQAAGLLAARSDSTSRTSASIERPLSAARTCSLRLTFSSRLRMVSVAISKV